MADKKKARHIRITSHPGARGNESLTITWGAPNPIARGPIIATVKNPLHRNVIGTHSGSYMVYRALAVASGALDPDHKPDFTNTAPTEAIGPHSQWFEPDKIVSLDPLGAVVSEAFHDYLERGYDIRPTIAIAKAHIILPELSEAIEQGRLKPDGTLFKANGECLVTKAAIEPVWYLSGIAKRFNVSEADLRETLFEQTGGMFPELVTRPDLEVFLPPIGGLTVYLFGDVKNVIDPKKQLAVRVHDECNGSDVFGSDICTCRPYLIQGIEVCIETAQQGGSGVIVYFRKEGRALGEVTKFLVYNARKRQAGGDRADAYFARTECVAGVQDMRLQELMPDVLHWLGINKIDTFISMSNMKYDAIIKSGIAIHKRLPIPDDRIPHDARVEIEAKKAAGYFSEDAKPSKEFLANTKGRGLSE